MRRHSTNASHDCDKDELQIRFLQEQVRAWRKKCKRTLGEPKLFAEGLRKRRIADLELMLDNDGQAWRGKYFTEGSQLTYVPYDTRKQLQWR